MLAGCRQRKGKGKKQLAELRRKSFIKGQLKNKQVRRHRTVGKVEGTARQTRKDEESWAGINES